MRKRLLWTSIGVILLTPPGFGAERPNILFCIADDWGWPHASALGDPVVKTPTFDSIAANGVVFLNAFAKVPSCTQSRNSILTGQYPWRLKTGASLWSVFPEGVQTYPNMLAAGGYHVGSWRKAFGPVIDSNPPAAGTKYKSPKAFFDARPDAAPFCFWFGSSDPHRPYDPDSGVRSGMKAEDVVVPPYLPDTMRVRKDICDYYFEVQRFDRDVGGVFDEYKYYDNPLSGNERKG